jgi:hypothetical protein
MDYLREGKRTRERESVSKEVLCCNTLQHTATHCNTLQERERQQRGALLQHTATHCSTLQHTARERASAKRCFVATHCNTLQHTATHCSTLQHTATHCNTLQERERQQRGALSIYKYDYVCVRVCFWVWGYVCVFLEGSSVKVIWVCECVWACVAVGCSECR